MVMHNCPISKFLDSMGLCINNHNSGKLNTRYHSQLSYPNWKQLSLIAGKPFAFIFFFLEDKETRPQISKVRFTKNL